MIGLTRHQAHLLSFIESHAASTDVCPTFQQMLDAMDITSRSSLTRTLKGLEERGAIRRLKNRARAIEVLQRAEPHHTAAELKEGLAAYSTMELRRELVRRQEGAPS